MPFAVRVSTLYCGQGQANVIEVYKSTAPFILNDAPPTLPDSITLDFLAIVDLGTSSHGDKAKSSVISYLHPLLLYKKGVIDWVYISHLDDDHYNLFQSLSEFYQQQYTSKITISNLVIGGERRDSHTSGIGKHGLMLTTLISWGYLVTNSLFIPTCHKHEGSNPYIPPQPQPSLPSISFTHLLDDHHFLQGNVLIQQAQINPPSWMGTLSDSVFVNTGSTILLLSVVNRSVGPLYSAMLTGDATNWTIRRLLNLDELSDPNATPPISYPYNFGLEVKYITIPHHGSFTTMADGHPPGFYSLRHLICNNYKPNVATASAQMKHNHPCESTFNVFRDNIVKYACLPDPPPHSYAVYTSTGSFSSPLSIDKHIYTTFYQVPQPPSVPAPTAQPLPVDTHNNIHFTYHSNPIAGRNQYEVEKVEFL
ncbi:MAG: hypothetical protein FWC15_03420 [Fibromonadales bacterium]|nr:hypothetical protein [Fibromonadales bacterium]